MKHQVFFFVVSLFCSSTFPMYRYNGPDRFDIIDKITKSQIIYFLNIYASCMEEECPGVINEIGAIKAIEAIRRMPFTFVNKVHIVNAIEELPYPKNVKKLVKKKYEAIEAAH